MHKTFLVDGLKCQSCVNKLLAELDVTGVDSVEVDLPTGKTDVSYDDTRLGETEIVARIADAGFSIKKEIDSECGCHWVAEETGKSSCGSQIKTISKQSMGLPILDSNLAQVEKSENEIGTTKYVLQVNDMDCASCVSNVERALLNTKGIQNAFVNLPSGRAVIHVTQENADSIAAAACKAVSRAGYGAKKIDQSNDNANQAWLEKSNNDARYWIVRSSVGAVLLLAILSLEWTADLEQNWVKFTILILATVLQTFVGWPYFRSAIRRLLGGGTNMDTLVAIGSTAAFVSGTIAIFGGGTMMAFHEAGMILTVLSIGKLLEAISTKKAKQNVADLMQLTPQKVTVERGTTRSEVSVEKVNQGDTILIAAGQNVPLDADIVEGQTEVDQSWLTGEPLPVSKQVGDSVYAGTINGNGRVKAKVTSNAKNTTLAQTIQLVHDAQVSKAKIQRLADTIVSYFVPAVLVIGLITFTSWMVFAGDFQNALRCTIAALIVACPCAMGLATPIAVLVGSGYGAKKGILIKNAAALESSASLKTVVLDKTGTITAGKPRLVNISIVQTDGSSEFQFDEDQVVQWVASLESTSSHPLAKGVIREFENRKLDLLSVKQQTTVPGKGIVGNIDQREVIVGNLKLMNDYGVSFEGTTQRTDSIEVYVAVESKPVATLHFKDELLATSAGAIEQIRKMGIDVVLLTGDRRENAMVIAESVGITDVYADVKPSEKMAVIQKFQDAGKVAMVGDGINDAAALASADLGIAIGAGADVAKQSADIILSQRDLNLAVETIRLGRSTVRTIKQNLGWAFVYNMLLIPVAAGILIPFGGFGLPPTAAAAAMAFSDVSVITNSLLIPWRTRRSSPKS